MLMIPDNYALIHMFVAWNNVRGRTPPLIKTDCHVHENKHANEAVSTHHALSMQLNNTPNLV